MALNKDNDFSSDSNGKNVKVKRDMCEDEGIIKQL